MQNFFSLPSRAPDVPRMPLFMGLSKARHKENRLTNGGAGKMTNRLLHMNRPVAPPASDSWYSNLPDIPDSMPRQYLNLVAYQNMSTEFKF